MSAPKATSSIGRKILIRSLIVAIVPLLLLGIAVYLGVASMRNNASTKVDESRDLLSEETIVVTSQSQANSVAKEINLVLVERIEDVLSWSRSVSIVDGAREAGTFSREEGLTEQSIDELEEKFELTKTTGVAFRAKAYLGGELGANEDFREIFITDKYGYNAALTNRTSDFVQSDEDWWQEAWENGLSISDVEFDESAEVFSIDIAARIQNVTGGSGEGVIKASLEIAFVQDIADANSTEQVDFIVSLANGQLIAETSTDNDLDRMMNEELDPSTVSDGLVNAIETGKPGSRAGDEVVWSHTDTRNAEIYQNIEGFEGFDWIVVSEQSTESAFAPIKGLEELDDDINTSGNNLLTITLGVLFLAGLVAFFSARYLADSIVNPIRKLTSAASDAATNGLPSAVAEINSEGADPESIEAPQVDISTGDELEVLAGSFNQVQGSAIRLAAEQAVSRRNTSEMFVNLGRRNQSLLKRQLRFIDGLEKSETDPDTLESLFKLDHLATRMRRNAESLLVIAGDRTPRRWAVPVPIEQTVQAALAEVENYERVDMSGLAEGQVQGNVVADVAHVLAELIENAINFSPPNSEVDVTGSHEEKGYTIVISDRGMGMSEEEIAEANERLRTVSDQSEVPARYLGLYVVGQLADRHGLEVHLASPSEGVGLEAVVVLPSSIAEEVSDSTDDEDDVVALTESAEKDPDVADEQPVVLVDGEEVDSPSSVDADQAVAEDASVEAKEDSDAESAVAKPVEIKKVDPPKVETRPASVPSNEFGRRSDDEDQTAMIEGKEFRRRKTSRRKDDEESTDFESTTSEAADTNSADTNSADTNSADTNSAESDRGETSSVSAEGTTSESGVEESEASDGDDLSRRSNDAGFTPEDPKLASAVADLGFARRPSKKNTGRRSSTPKVKKETKESTGSGETVGSAESTGDVMEDAEQNRNRWSQFQRGKEDAEGEIVES